MLTAALDLLVFDHNLQLMWTTQVLHLPSAAATSSSMSQPLLQLGAADALELRHATVHEAAVHVLHQGLGQEDRGLILAGSSLHLGDLLGRGAARGLPDR